MTVPLTDAHRAYLAAFTRWLMASKSDSGASDGQLALLEAERATALAPLQARTTRPGTPRRRFARG